jgi:hypothetical protein
MTLLQQQKKIQIKEITARKAKRYTSSAEVCNYLSNFLHIKLKLSKTAPSGKPINPADWDGQDLVSMNNKMAQACFASLSNMQVLA